MRSSATAYESHLDRRAWLNIFVAHQFPHQPLLFMILLLRPLCFLSVFLLCSATSGFGYLLEAPVTLKLDYVPRRAAVTSVKTLTTAQVLASLGFNNGILVCVADSSDASLTWSFKVKSIQGSKTTYTDLGGKLGLESLGYSLVSRVKEVSSVTSVKALNLGIARSTQALKAEIVFSGTEGFDLYGTLWTVYFVTQAAGETVATWTPGACTVRMTGAYRSVSGEEASTASLTAVIGAFKMSTVSVSAPSATAGMVSVVGGTLPNDSELRGLVVEDFQIGKTEVTWGEWKAVREWAVLNGYSDLVGVGAGTGDNYPVTWVNWYDLVKWCNAKSEKEGRTPVYQVNGATYKTGESVPTVEYAANGYRLPTEVEWEWAARGGRQTHGYIYSGSNDVNAVAWYGDNSGGATHEVGKKAANELGISDMTGNVWEWCWDLYSSGRAARLVRGGSWFDVANYSFVSIRDDNNGGNPAYRGTNVGFRLACNFGQ